MFAYVARQAIYDKQKRVYAYELLFRNGIENCFPDVLPDEATSSMLAGSHLSVGVENITFNKPAFINFHEETLLYRFPFTLNPLNVVIEIVETVNISPELLEACEHIANLGYKIALDDYDFDPKWDALMPFIRYIKLEVNDIKLDDSTRIEQLKTFQQQGKILIAERVETMQQFDALVALGIEYFQGYFLSKPEVVKHKNIEVSLSSIAELVGISVSANFNLDRINTIFEADLGLSFKLMRFINNPMFNKRHPIDSLAHALKYLGQVELKKFIALLAIANLKGNKPLDLILSSLCRAQFCKLLAAEMEQKEDPPNSFILGLFSLVDALLDKPMPELMQMLPFSQEFRDVLCQKRTHGKLAQQYHLCIAFERANWDDIDKLAHATNIELPTLFSMYYESMDWAHNMKSTFK